MSKLITLTDAAAEIGVSKRWLQYWLSAHPVDNGGIPFYVPIGRNKRFDVADIDRIKAAIREGERCRLHSTGAKGLLRRGTIGPTGKRHRYNLSLHTEDKDIAARQVAEIESDTGKVTSMAPRQS